MSTYIEKACQKQHMLSVIMGNISKSKSVGLWELIDEGKQTNVLFLVKSLFALRQGRLDRTEGGEFAVQYHKLQRVGMFMSLFLSLVQRSKCTAYSDVLLLFVFYGCSGAQLLLMGWKLTECCTV